MRILIVSDIHANIVALETVLAAAGSVDTLWCVGDVIGYGPRPNECIASIQQHAEYSICGNHDWACIGKVDLSDFNPDARAANEWNGQQLTSENLEWLASLQPLIERLDAHPDFTMAHGSPREPVWEYLLGRDQALANFKDSHFQTSVCFIGHSHVPLYFRLDQEGTCHRGFPGPEKDTDILELTEDDRFIVNPGSVGQPRDQDPRAAFAILDTEERTVQFQRVEYNIAKTQEQMLEANLPIPLIRRLSFGL